MLNPNVNSFVDSRKIYIPSVGPKLQNGALLLIKFKDHMKHVSSLTKMSKELQRPRSIHGEVLPLSKEKKGTMKHPPFGMNPLPSLYRKYLGLGFPKLGLGQNY